MNPAVGILVAELEKACKDGCPRCEDGTTLHEYPNGEWGHLVVGSYGRTCFMAETRKRIKELTNARPTRHPDEGL